MKTIIKRFVFALLLLSISANLGWAKDGSEFVIYEDGYVFCAKGAIVVEKKRVRDFPAANQVYVPENWYFNPLNYSAQPFGYESEELYSRGLNLGKSKVFKVRDWFYRITAVEILDYIKK